MRRWILATLSALAITVATAMIAAPPASAEAWDIAKAAAPYKGTQLNVIFLDRPGYRAIIKLLPEFEQTTGIKVNYEIVPYENTREKQVLNFNGQGDLSIALVDLVWIGEFAENGWIEPIDKFTGDASITDPESESEGLLPAAARRVRQLGRQGLWPSLRQLFRPALLQQVHAQGRRLRQAARRPGTS